MKNEERAGSVDSPSVAKDFVGHPIVGLHSASRYNSASLSGLNSVGAPAKCSPVIYESNKENVTVPSNEKIRRFAEKKLRKDINQNVIKDPRESKKKSDTHERKNGIVKLVSSNKGNCKTKESKQCLPIHPNKPSHMNKYANLKSANSVTDLRECHAQSIRNNLRQGSPARSTLDCRTGSQPPNTLPVFGIGADSFKEKLNKFNNLSTEDLSKFRNLHSSQQVSYGIRKNSLSGEEIYNSLNRRKFSIPNMPSARSTSGVNQTEEKVACKDKQQHYFDSLKSPSFERISFRQKSRENINKTKITSDSNRNLNSRKLIEAGSNNDSDKKLNRENKLNSFVLVPSSSLYNRRISGNSDKKINNNLNEMNGCKSSGVVQSNCISPQSAISSRQNNQNTNKFCDAHGIKDSLVLNLNNAYVATGKSPKLDIYSPTAKKHVYNSNENEISKSTGGVSLNSRIRPYISNSINKVAIREDESGGSEYKFTSVHPKLTKKSNFAHNPTIFSPIENSKIRPFVKSPQTEELKAFPASSVSSFQQSLPGYSIPTATIGNKQSSESIFRNPEYEFKDSMAIPTNDVTVKELVELIRSIKPAKKALPGYEIEKTPRYVVGVCMDECYPGLYIGDFGAAMNKDYLQRVGITHVLNTSEGNVFCNFPVDPNANDNFYNDIGIKYLGLQLSDVPSANITQYFEESADFIDNCLSTGGKILVHCFMGVSRSSTIATSFLMQKKGMHIKEALKALRQNRSIYPNEGFLNQLIQLQIRLDMGITHGKAVP